MNKIILIFGIIFVVLLVGIGIVLSFGNVGEYNEEEQTMIIRKSVLSQGVLAEAQLKTSQVVRVFRGNGRQIAEFDLNNNEKSYSKVFTDMEFYDMNKGMKKFDREFTYKYKRSLGFKTVNDYVKVCEEKQTTNGTQYESCSQEIVGSHQEEKFEWVELDTSKELPIGQITIGIFTDVYAGDKVEWIPTLFGVRINQWAQWEDFMNVSLLAYYSFEEDSGTNLPDVSGDPSKNGTLTNMEDGDWNIGGGILGNSLSFGGTDEYVNMPYTIADTTGTLSFWVNSTGVSGGILGRDDTGSNAGDWTMFHSAGSVVSFTIDDGGGAHTISSDDDLPNAWTHVVLLWGTGGMKMYINGTLQIDDDAYTGAPTLGSPWAIGAFYKDTGPVNAYIGQVDEIGLWNRRLNTTEIDNLWNNGAGITLFPPRVDFFPHVEQVAPVNALNFTIPSITFNCSASDDFNLVNVSLIINNTVISTNNSGINDTFYIFTETLPDGTGFYNWSCSAYDNSSQINITTGRNLTYSNDLLVSLVSPVNDFNSSLSLITFNGTASDDISIVNVTLFIDARLNETNSSGFNNSFYIFIKNLSDGSHNWTYEACDDIGVCITATTRDINVNTVLPSVSIISPTSTIFFRITNTSQELNWTITDTSLDECWFNYNFINTTVTCNDNNTLFNLTEQRNITLWANDTFGNTNNDFQEWGYVSTEISKTFNATSFETEKETFYINISTNGTVPTNAKLIYNGTSYSATITDVGSNSYNISRTIDIPIGIGSKNFHFNFTVLGTEVSSTNASQTITLTNFTFCQGVTPYINITFKNETILEEEVTSTISSTWNYWLGTGTNFKALSYSDVSENFNYTFCLDGVNRTLNSNVSLSYANSVSQQRNFADDFTLTNATTEQVLFLLPTAEGVFITFQVLNVVDQPISGVTSNVTKAGTLIASGTTDDAGTISFFLDPDTSYTFQFFKIGFGLVTTTLTPTQTTFTIRMGVVEVIEEDDFTRGITYSISPGIVSLVNNTFTYFNFTLTSSFWDVSDFGFNLSDQAGNLLSSTSATTNGGTLFIFQNTSNHTRITMTFFWNITGNVSIGSTFWTVFDSSGTGFGLTTFFNHLGDYIDTEMFGLNPNSLVILVYIIIFIVVGIMSFKYGIRSPGTISVMIFGLAFLFEFHLGWIPSVSGIPILTTLFALVSIGLIMREGLR